MNGLNALIRRNTKIFFRTKGNLLFSTLSILILIGLHFVIFRNLFSDNWEQICAEFADFSISREKLLWLNDNLMFAAIIPISSVTVSLVALGLMTADREKNVLSDFLVSPIGRNTLLSSYLISSFLIGICINAVFIAFFNFYFLAVYGIGFTLLQILWIVLSTIGSLIFANIFMLFIITFIKSQQSLGAVGTISGTMIGFLSGAYIAVGMFGKTISNIFSCLPFLQLTVLTRQAFLTTLEQNTPLTKELITGEIAQSFGIELWLGNQLIPPWGIALMTAGTTVILLIGLIFRFDKLKKAD